MNLQPAEYEGLELADWSENLFVPKRYKVVHGGRGSGKTYHVCAALLMLARDRKMRICCAREHQNTIEESAKEALVFWIHKLGLEDFYTVQQYRIIGANGTLFYFRGMSKMTNSDIKGLEGVDILWFEEADRMTEKTFRLIRPTIRKDGSEIWLTFNPQFRHDIAYKMFVDNDHPQAWVHQVLYMDNPWLPNVLRDEMEFDKEFNPEVYRHIWLGEPDDLGEGMAVLPYVWLIRAVDAHKELNIDLNELIGKRHAGLDVADSIADNAYCLRDGPIIEDIRIWKTAGDLIRVAEIANTYCLEDEIIRLVYDQGGPGGSIRSYMNRRKGRGKYFAEGLLFGSEVAGGDRVYTRGKTNKQFFLNRAAQLGWNMRQRLERTMNMLNGHVENPKNCLFISSDIENINDYLAQMAQPQWEYTQNSKLRIEKSPDDAPSPDKYDASILAFAADSRAGLRSHKVVRK